MNIFVVSECPYESARMLPDKHIVKMPLECCQMISIIYSSWYHNYGTIPKKDGNAYQTKGGAFRNHPCTIWAAKTDENLAWLIAHGIGLCIEYTHRYGKTHSCENSLDEAHRIFKYFTQKSISVHKNVNNFARAMPDVWKYDKGIDDVTAYRYYVNSKPWVSENYLRDPSRKPVWID